MSVCFFRVFVEVVINLTNWETGKFNIKLRKLNNLFSYIVYKTKGTQGKIEQNLDLDFFQLAPWRKIVKSALDGRPLN